jgi:hypothetical protein
MCNTERMGWLKNRSTLYELALCGPSSRLLCYTRKSRVALIAALRKYGPQIVAITGVDNLTVAGQSVTIGAYSVRFTGRTEREAVIGGELAWIGGAA